MSEAFQILQLADLLIDSGRRGNFDSYLSSLARYIESTKVDNFDYIVISGNLTKNATDEEFELAFAALERLSRHLRRDQAGDWERRVLVVPGPKDGHREPPGVGPIDFTNFNRFYTRYFSRFDYDNRPLESNWHKFGIPVHLSVRVLDDFTSVGFFWDRALHDDSEHILWKSISDAHRFWSAKRAMLLLSSCVPQKVAGEKYFKDKFCRYLVGRTPHAMLHEVRYSALKWHVAAEEPSSTMRGNIHAFKGDTTAPLYRSQTFDFQPRKDPIVLVQTVELPPPTPPTPPQIFKALLAKLYTAVKAESEMDSKPRPIHVIRGVPGVGKNQFFERLRAANSENFSSKASAEDPDGFQYIIQPVEIWENPQVLKPKLDHYNVLLEKRINRASGKVHGIMLFLDHNKYIDFPDVAMSERFHVLNVLRDYCFGRCEPSLLYMSDNELILESYYNPRVKTRTRGGGGGFEPRAVKLGDYWLPMRDMAAFDELLKAYPHVPFDPADLGKLCGSLCGIGKQILDAVASDPDPVDAVRVERWKNVINKVKESYPMTESFHRFKEFLKHVMFEKDPSVKKLIDKGLDDYADAMVDDPWPNTSHNTIALDQLNRYFKDRFDKWGIDSFTFDDLPLISYLVK